MKKLFKYAAFAGLVLTIAPALLFWTDRIDLDMAKRLILLGTLLWLGLSPLVYPATAAQNAP